MASVITASGTSTMPTAVNDVVLETKPAAIHADSAKESSIGEAMERAPVARLATRQTMVGRMGTQCYALLEDTKQKSSKKVRFNPQMPNAIWIADSNYDRRSIVVDLSKTPFALFRKDAVLMAKSNGAQPPPRSAVAACTQSAVASTADGRCLCARQNSPENIELKRLGSSAASRANDTGATAGTVSGPSVPSLATTSSTEAAASTAVGCSSSGVAAAAAVAAVAVGLPETTETRQRSQFFGSWDSDESDSAGHTDTEDISEHSEGCDGDAERRSEEPAFYGVWRRESSEGYEELLLSSGVPKRAAAIALRKHPVHIIDHDGSYFRLIVKNGLSKVDNTFFIGDEPREVSSCCL